LLGAGWLIIKSEGELQAWARGAGRIGLIAIAVVSIYGSRKLGRSAKVRQGVLAMPYEF